jgi:hypothetical protein
MGTGGRAGTGGTGMAGTGGAGTGGGNGVGGAGGGGTGGAAVPGTGGAAVPGTGGAAVPGTGGAAGVGGGSGGTPACANGMKDNAETDIDCGGGAASAACPRCGEGKACLAGSDCLAGLQCAFGRCRAKYPPIDDSLVAFWPLDTDTKDATANRNDTVTYRSAAAVAGKVGGAYQLGGDGCLIAPSSASLDFTGSTKLTMMAWVNPTPSCASGQDVGIVLNKESSYEMAVSCADRAYQYALLPSTQSGWAWQGSKVLTTGVWHHVAAAWDGTIMRLYVDGALVDGITQTGVLADHGWGLGIGCRSVGGDESTGAVTSFFTGIVDEVAVYKRTLSAQEIASYYNATR